MYQEWMNLLVAPVAVTIGWFGQRWLTGARHMETTARLLSVVDLVERLQRAGLSLEDAKKAADSIKAGAPTLPISTAKSVVASLEDEIPEDIDLPSQYTSTYAMKFRLDSKLSTLDAQINEALTELRILLSDDEYEAAIQVQSSWTEYRIAEGEFASVGARGGTGETIYAFSAMISVSETRLAMLREQIREAKVSLAEEDRWQREHQQA